MSLETNFSQSPTLVNSPKTREFLFSSFGGVPYRYVRWPNGQESFPYLGGNCLQLWELAPASIQQNPKLFWQLFGPEERESLQVTLTYALRKGQLWQWCGAIVTPSGQRKVVTTLARGTFDPDGSLMLEGVWFENEEVNNDQIFTEFAQKKKQPTLDKNRINFILNASPVGIFSCRPDDYRVTFVSANIQEITGYQPEDFYNDPQFGFRKVHPEDLAIVESSLAKLKACGSSKVVYRMEHQDGKYRWLQNELKLIRDQLGKPLEIIGSYVDISDRVETEMALRESEERFRTLVDNIPGVVYRYQCLSPSQWTVTYLSEDLEELSGYHPQQLLGKSLGVMSELVHPEDRPQVEQKLATAIAKKQPFRIEYRLLRQDGSYRLVCQKGQGIVNHEGELNCIDGLILDLTERKLAEDEMIKALAKEKELSEFKYQFVTRASHEFRTPLTIIKSSAELLERYQDSREAQLEEIKDIKEAVGHLTEVLDEILAFSKTESEQLEFKLTPLKVQQFCQNLITQFQRTTPTHFFRFEIEGEKACPLEFQTDEKLLRHILTNLLSNAVKYSPQGGEIEIKLKCSHESIAIEVRDRGLGIPETSLPYLFEPFYRATNVGKIPGTGLGLSIVKNCVEIHGGTITVNSYEGQGTTFCVMLPSVSPR